MQTIKQVMEIKIIDIELSARAQNCLARMNVKTLSDLTRIKEEELYTIRNAGKKTIEEIKSLISTMELSFQMSDRDWLLWGYRHIQLIKEL